MSEYLQKLYKTFEQHRNKDNADGQKAYLKNQFEFYGIKTNDRRALFKQFLKENGLPEYNDLKPIIEALWYRPERECQHCALELAEKYIQQAGIDFIYFIEYMICNKPWWDTVDMIATHIVADYFKRFTLFKLFFGQKWIKSDNIWLQRTAILYQLKFKGNTNHTLLFRYINEVKDSDEFFIKKAIGWALREYSKTKPELVLEFIKNTNLKSLSKTEGLKYLKSKKII